MMRTLCCCLFLCAITVLVESRGFKGCLYQCLASQEDVNRHHGYDEFPWNDESDFRDVSLAPRLNPGDCEHEICVDADNYPSEDKINKAIMKNEALTSYFGTIVEPHFNLTLSTRYGGGKDIKNMCDARKLKKRPRRMQNIFNKNQFIVNTERYRQDIIYEYCENSGSPCWCNKCQYPANYFTKCTQHYMVIRLAVFINENETTFDSFKIPNGCVCEYGQY